MATMTELESKNRDELETIAKEYGIIGYSALKKPSLSSVSCRRKHRSREMCLYRASWKSSAKATASYDRILSGVAPMMSMCQIPRFVVST
jgi:hypothetical protein